jgi:hypothetical protein
MLRHQPKKVMSNTGTNQSEAGVVHFRMAPASNKPTTNGQGRHRFQELRIVRRDALVTAYVDLGPSYMFRADPLFIPGGQVVNGRGEAWHTVAELREIAEEFRSRPVHREVEPSDLQSAFHEMAEERKRRRTNQSTFGTLGQLVRSDV